jgi:hypothetical protein
MAGGTTITFVMGGVADAVKQARASAGDGDVAVAGGANVVQQFIAAALLGELHLHAAPVLLSARKRLFENVGDPVFEPVDVIASPAVTHIRYRARASTTGRRPWDSRLRHVLGCSADPGCRTERERSTSTAISGTRCPGGRRVSDRGDSTPG